MKFRKISLICAMAVTIAGSVTLPAFGMAYETTAGMEAGNSFTDGNYAAFNSGVSMDVSYGYEGNAKSGRYVPVNFSFKNQLDSEFQGTVQAIAMESDYDIYQYEYPVSLKAFEASEESLDIPVGRADVLYVKLLDSQGRELIRKRLKMNVTSDIAELFVGVLSDEPETMSYMDGVGVNYSSVKIKTFEMDTEKMPDKVIGLDLLDVLVITDYDTKRLSTDQVSAIWEWVKEGGTLLLGTGSRVDDTLYAFRSDILEEDYAPPSEKSVDMGVEYSSNGPGDSFMNLVCADVSLKGGTGVLSNDEFPVLTSVSKGKGRVGVAAYDFVDIASFCQVQRSYVDKLFTALLGETKLNDLSSYLYSGNSGQFWSVQNMLNTGNVDKLPNLVLYTAVILGYIVLVGPGLYLFLKKQERRRFYRTAVVTVSLSFSAVVYLMGVGTRFKDTFFTYATILDTTENYVDEYTYINMRTPYNKAYTIALDPSYDLLPITRSSSYEMKPVPRFMGSEDYKVKISYGDKDTRISAQNAAAFTPKYYSLRKRTSNTEHKGLLGDITLFEGNVYGTVTNEYPFQVEKVGILMYGKMVVIDELKPGETMNLNGLPVINYPINNSFLVSARVTGSYQYPKADIEDPAYMLALSRTNILSFYLDKYSSFYNPEARIVAFSKDQSDSQFLAGGNYETYGMSMFTSTINVKTKKDGETSRSALMKTPTVVSGQYYADSNAIYGVDPVSLEYFLGNDMEVEKLTFENPSDEFLNSENFYYTTIFKGNIYFYNHDTGNYDAMEPDKTVYKAWELTPYLSPGNTLTVKYVCDNTSENNWYVTLPMLTVAGRDK
ncbi:MAG TPA: hypothetical protein DEQ64_15430 [Lachnoclostridium sp.]|jgi:hypothetical protein|uniref:hypothetical protein n=1 Tax=Lacrimispora sp. TaxID=2719234 RepID=UPI000EE6E178|nr:hypothetical protein [Lacrimispora sp.]HCD45091.1 hypothetical protein [Lachnoclostridium sp.]